MSKREPLSPTAWEGLTDSETGQLRSSTPSDRLGVPGRVEIDGDDLVFYWDDGGVTFEGDDASIDGPATLRFLTVPATLLERFLRLRSDENVVKFARRFGPLMPRGLYAEDEKATGRPGEHRESLREWRQLQREFNAVLALVAAVREKKSPAEQTFMELHTLGALPAVDQLTHNNPPRILQEWRHYSLSERLTAARSIFMKKIKTYSRYCALRPNLILKSTRTGVRFDLVFQDARADFLGCGLSLFGALTVQLMSAATGSALALCSGCGDFFIPRRRRPAFGKRRYCRACGRTVAVRDAVTDYRDRERKKQAVRRRSK